MKKIHETIKKFLCHIGFHHWSSNRGGVRICRWCPAVDRYYGISGLRRQLELTTTYQRESDAELREGWLKQAITEIKRITEHFGKVMFQNLMNDLQAKGFKVSQGHVMKCQHGFGVLEYLKPIAEKCPCVSLIDGSIKIEPLQEGVEYVFSSSKQWELDWNEYFKIRKTYFDHMQRSTFFTMIFKSANESRIKFNIACMKEFEEYIDELRNSMSSIQLYLESEGKELSDDATIWLKQRENNIGNFPYSYFKKPYSLNCGIRICRDNYLTISCEDQKISAYKIQISNVTVVKRVMFVYEKKNGCKENNVQ